MSSTRLSVAEVRAESSNNLESDELYRFLLLQALCNIADEIANASEEV